MDIHHMGAIFADTKGESFTCGLGEHREPDFESSDRMLWSEKAR